MGELASFKKKWTRQHTSYRNTTLTESREMASNQNHFQVVFKNNTVVFRPQVHSHATHVMRHTYLRVRDLGEGVTS